MWWIMDSVPPSRPRARSGFEQCDLTEADHTVILYE